MLQNILLSFNFNCLNLDHSSTNAVKYAIVGSRLNYCNALVLGMYGSNIDKLHVSRTALHVWCQVHAVKTTSNQPLKNCTGFLFEPESASSLRHSSIKSEQGNSQHSLCTSWRTTDRRGHFIFHHSLFTKNRQWVFNWSPMFTLVGYQNIE